ncbi:MAG: M55 family metallopeptidase [Burkholderiaceae bacterium]|jgi:D-amino peptidase|nr:M55 family metallopeptidase [Burkholderiaceae bacterium]
MKILISVDIEGIAGVFNVEQTRPGNGEYERARRWMTEEANAAIRGAFAGGATEVLVNDSHGSFRNLLADDLDPRALFVLGKPRYLGMMGGLDPECDGVMMIGYHSRAQGRGILAHTINSFAFARVTVNGLELSEAGLYGALAAESGVPVILASGDDVFIDENRDLFTRARWVQTKVAYGHASGVTMAPSEVQASIEQAARLAVQDCAEPSVAAHSHPHLVVPPLECLLTTQGPAIADLFCTWPALTRLDGVTVRFAAASMQDLIRMLNSLSAMSFMLR